VKILVTGGAGYIGSHTVVALLNAGAEVIVLDNFSNSSPAALDRVHRIAGKDFVRVQGDIRDRAVLDGIFSDHAVDAVIHFAGLKVTGDSIAMPLDYYDANVVGSVRLFEAMDRHGIRRIVFSSSAAVYDAASVPPIKENAALKASTPYGRTKQIIETILHDLAARPVGPGQAWRASILRYFNPVGAHVSGLLGEDPKGVPTNLMPAIAQTVAGRRERLLVFGADYPTRDGTCVRDFIHVEDLAQGHLAALRRLDAQAGVETFNLGTGNGFSVLEMVDAYKMVCGREIPYTIAGRRSGDIPASWADPSAAETALAWKATLGLERMCADTWRWQTMNPDGYDGGPH